MTTGTGPSGQPGSDPGTHTETGTDTGMRTDSRQPRWESGRGVVLIGPPTAGKSSVGALLADALGVPFADTDTLVARAAHKPVSDIFVDDGELVFRELADQFGQPGQHAGADDHLVRALPANGNPRHGVIPGAHERSRLARSAATSSGA